MSLPADLQARYVALANALVPLTTEAAALEEAMSAAKVRPMSPGVYNNIVLARRTIEDLIDRHA